MSSWSRKLLFLGAILLLSGLSVVEPATGQISNVEETPLVMTLDELEEEIVRREDDLRRYRERLAELEVENSKVGANLEAREDRLRGQEDRLRGKIVTLCRMSRGGYIQLLRGARTWAEIARRSQIARAVVDQDIEEIREHQLQVEELREQRARLLRRVEVQRQLQARIARYRRELEDERRRRLRAQRYGLPHTTPASGDFDDLDEQPTPLEL